MKQHILEQNGFIRMSDDANRISLNMGYTENGFADKVYHIHLRYAGDNAELYYRYYLNEHPDIAKEYETLKLQLWKQYEHNRDAYTDAKTDFISKWTAEALKEYGNNVRKQSAKQKNNASLTCAKPRKMRNIKDIENNCKSV